MSEVLRTQTVLLDNRVKLIVSGEIDVMTAGQFRKALRGAISSVGSQVSTGARVVLDMTDVTYFGSAAVGVLIAGQRAGRKQGIDVTISACSPEARRVLAVTGLLQTFGLDGPDGLNGHGPDWFERGASAN